MSTFDWVCVALAAFFFGGFVASTCIYLARGLGL